MKEPMKKVYVLQQFIFGEWKDRSKFNSLLPARAATRASTLKARIVRRIDTVVKQKGMK